MATPQLPADFSEFLKLLNAHGVEYLVVGGWAVGVHGYPRATIDIDIWVPMRRATADRLVSAFRGFGFDVPALSADVFLKPDQIVRIGVPPMRIEVMTTISGVEFDDCYPRGISVVLDGVPTRVIGLDDLKKNKQSSGRHNDLSDLEHLP